MKKKWIDSKELAEIKKRLHLTTTYQANRWVDYKNNHCTITLKVVDEFLDLWHIFSNPPIFWQESGLALVYITYYFIVNGVIYQMQFKRKLNL